MWRRSQDRNARRRVRFIDDNHNEENDEGSTLPLPLPLRFPGQRISSSIVSKASQGDHHHGRQNATTQKYKCNHKRSRNRFLTNQHIRQQDIQLAAEEIERLLLDEANTHNADQMVDTTYDDQPFQNYPQESDAEFILRDRNILQSSLQNPISSRPLRLGRRLSFPSLARRSCRTHGSAGGAWEESTQSLQSLGGHAVTVLPVVGSSRSQSNELTEQDVNAYGLFDSAGADEARLRHDDYLRRRHANISNPIGSTGSESLTLRSIFPTESSQDTNGVIYDLKKYATGVPFFTPILLALTTIFCVLVVVRLFVSLLTVAVGWLVVILLVARLFHQLIYRPVQLLRHLHTHPLTAWAFLGGLTGMARVCYARVYLVLAAFNIMMYTTKWNLAEEMMITTDDEYGYCFEDLFRPFDFDVVLDYCLPSDFPQIIQPPIDAVRNVVQYSIPLSTVFSMRQDLVLIWGLIEGLCYGFYLGVLWRLFLGCSVHPSPLSKWIHNNIWRFAILHYRECIRHRQQAFLLRSLRLRHQQECLQRRSSRCLFTATSTDDRKQCMICLEEFMDDNDGEGQLSSLYQRYFLRCRHSFHACCIQEWLEIKASCPICRIPLDDTLMISPPTTVTPSE